MISGSPFYKMFDTTEVWPRAICSLDYTYAHLLIISFVAEFEFEDCTQCIDLLALIEISRDFEFEFEKLKPAPLSAR